MCLLEEISMRRYITLFILCIVGIGLNGTILAQDSPPLTSLPLGDGKVSSQPQVGYVFSCRTRFGNAGGAQNDAPGSMRRRGRSTSPARPWSMAACSGRITN